MPSYSVYFFRCIVFSIPPASFLRSDDIPGWSQVDLCSNGWHKLSNPISLIHLRGNHNYPKTLQKDRMYLSGSRFRQHTFAYLRETSRKPICKTSAYHAAYPHSGHLNCCSTFRRQDDKTICALPCPGAMLRPQQPSAQCDTGSACTPLHCRPIQWTAQLFRAAIHRCPNDHRIQESTAQYCIGDVCLAAATDQSPTIRCPSLRPFR